jgi:hypothetical protein
VATKKAAKKAKSHHETFSVFDDPKLLATRQAWEADCIQASTFPPDVTQVLDWARDNQTPDPARNEVAYGLFPRRSNVAQAICEVVVAKLGRKKWVKMLRMRLRPELENRIYNRDVKAAQEVKDLYIIAIAGVFRLKYSHAADTLKIFGRSAELLFFLQGLPIALKGVIPGHNVRMEGRWLVIQKA